jgi:hypothetical protein
MKPGQLSERIASYKDRQKFLAAGGKFAPPKTKLLLSISLSYANAIGSSAGQSNSNLANSHAETQQHGDKFSPKKRR